MGTPLPSWTELLEDSATRPLRWWRWRVGFVYEPQGRGLAAHPLFALRAVLKFALRGFDSPLPANEPAFTFHRVDRAMGGRLERGAAYEIDVILPRAGGEAAITHMARQWARRAPHSFHILHLGEPEERGLELLVQETPLPPADGPLMLEFDTPYEFPAQKECAWALQADQLLRSLAQSVASFCGGQAPGPAPGWVAGWQWPRITPAGHFWHLERAAHASTGQGTQYLTGWKGPLLLHGDWPALWPLLLLGQELHVGPGRPLGQGHYRLAATPPLLDARLASPPLFESTWSRLLEEETPFTQPLADPGQEEQAVARLRAAVLDQRWQPTAAVSVEIPKKDAPGGLPGAARRISLLPAADRLVHQVLHEVLQPVLDRFLTESSVGYRQGRSIETARQLVAAAFAEGCSWVAETDIHSFFDQIPWEGLMGLLRQALPPADAATLAAVEAVLRTPVQQAGRAVPRDRGLLQGSPLSPLLANFYLHRFDESLRGLPGIRLVRYGDDFILLGRTEAEVTAALENARSLLAAQGLALKEEKTAILHSSRGFRFLGMELGGAAEAQAPAGATEDTLLRKPLYLTAPWQWAGLEHGALVLREHGQLRARVPLARVGEVVLAGLGGVSTPLLECCARQRIPVTLTSAGLGGTVLGALFPEPRGALDSLCAHQARFRALTPAQITTVARSLVAAKLDGHRAWLQELPKDEAWPLLQRLDAIHAALPGAADVQALRGHEGAAARLTFRWVNDRAADPFFHSTARHPREKRDAWNVLLDFSSWLLFTRLHTLLRARALHPYLGFLHSAENSYPSLVCDLQEPFRPRLERLLLRLVNRQQLRPDDFQQLPDLRWRLLPPAAARFIEAFETEMDTRLAADTLTLRRILEAQADALRAWARGQREDIFVFQPVLRRAPTAKRQTLPRLPKTEEANSPLFLDPEPRTKT